MDGLLDFDIPVPHEDGSFISQKVSDVVELIRHYHPQLDVKWIRPAQRVEGEDAYVIVERMSDGREAVVFGIKDESEFDERILERLYQLDATKHGDILSKIDRENAIVKEQNRKKHKEALDEEFDRVYHILKSPLHTYRHNGRIYD